MSTGVIDNGGDRNLPGSKVLWNCSTFRSIAGGVIDPKQANLRMSQHRPGVRETNSEHVGLVGLACFPDPGATRRSHETDLTSGVRLLAVFHEDGVCSRCAGPQIRQFSICR